MSIAVFFFVFLIPLLAAIFGEVFFWRFPASRRLRSTHKKLSGIRLSATGESKTHEITVGHLCKSERRFACALVLYDFMYSWLKEIKEKFFRRQAVTMMLTAMLCIIIAVNIHAAKAGQQSQQFNGSMTDILSGMVFLMLPLGVLIVPLATTLAEWESVIFKCEALLNAVWGDPDLSGDSDAPPTGVDPTFKRDTRAPLLGVWRGGSADDR
ncbi:MAG: hypothetical protein RLZZ326_2821 [Planctomycetota bacterium]|jgi:uncharacterized protein YqgC (DUF456 family)